MENYQAEEIPNKNTHSGYKIKEPTVISTTLYPVTKENKYPSESLKYTTNEQEPIKTVKPTHNEDYQTKEVLSTVSKSPTIHTLPNEQPVWQSR